MQHHNSPSKLNLANTLPHLTQTLSFTYKRHIPSPKKPAFLRDTTVKDLDQTCAVTLFSQRGGIQEQAHLQSQRWCQSPDLSSAAFCAQALASINLSLAPGERLVILCLFKPSHHSPGPRTTIRVWATGQRSTPGYYLPGSWAEGGSRPSNKTSSCLTQWCFTFPISAPHTLKRLSNEGDLSPGSLGKWGRCCIDNQLFSETIFAFGICLLSWEKVCYSTTGAKFSGQIYHLGFTGGQMESVTRAAASHEWWHPALSAWTEAARSFSANTFSPSILLCCEVLLQLWIQKSPRAWR